jgi:uncharacterized protein YukE
MANNECVTLDTKAFDAVSEAKDKLINDYNKINSDYNDIVNALLQNWEGRGADAFRSDATKVKTNIGGIQDILKTMCDTLTDCRAVFAESDKGMGEYNTAPFSE